MSDIMYGSTCLGWLGARGPLRKPGDTPTMHVSVFVEDLRAPRWAVSRESHTQVI